MKTTTQQECNMFINLILAVFYPILFAPTESWDLFAIKSAALFGLVFFQANGFCRQIAVLWKSYIIAHSHIPVCCSVGTRWRWMFYGHFNAHSRLNGPSDLQR